MDHDSFIHSPSKGHLGHFQVLMVVTAAINSLAIQFLYNRKIAISSPFAHRTPSSTLWWFEASAVLRVYPHPPHRGPLSEHS